MVAMRMSWPGQSTKETCLKKRRMEVDAQYNSLHRGKGQRTRELLSYSHCTYLSNLKLPLQPGLRQGKTSPVLLLQDMKQPGRGQCSLSHLYTWNIARPTLNLAQLAAPSYSIFQYRETRIRAKPAKQVTLSRLETQMDLLPSYWVLEGRQFSHNSLYRYESQKVRVFKLGKKPLTNVSHWSTNSSYGDKV